MEINFKNNVMELSGLGTYQSLCHKLKFSNLALQPESITKECAKVPNKNELRLKFKHQLFCFIIPICSCNCTTKTVQNIFQITR